MAYVSSSDLRLRPFTAVAAVRRLFRNPEDTRQVFIAMNALRGRSGLRTFARFAATRVGAAVLVERRSLHLRLQEEDALRALPVGSLSRVYIDFMDAEQLTLAGLIAVSDGWNTRDQDTETTLFRERMRDMHDLTHVLTGYGRDGLGELCLLAFMSRQTGNLGAALIALMGMRRFPRGAVGRRARKAVLTAFWNGGKADWLPGLDWEDLLGRDLETLRDAHGVRKPVAYLDLKS